MKILVYIKFNDNTAFEATLAPWEIDFEMTRLLLHFPEGTEAYLFSQIKSVDIKFLDQQKGQASDGAAVSTPASRV